MTSIAPASRIIVCAALKKRTRPLTKREGLHEVDKEFDTFVEKPLSRS